MILGCKRSCKRGVENQRIAQFKSEQSWEIKTCINYLQDQNSVFTNNATAIIEMFCKALDLPS
jgi:hypothetical protein